MAKIFVRKKLIYLLVGPLFVSTTQTFAHPGSTEELGMYHAFMQIEHTLPFLGIGIFAAFLMLLRKSYSVILANGALIAALLCQTIPHSFDRSILFGLEFFLGTAFISLFAWRAIYWLYTFLVSWFENFKRHSWPSSSKCRPLNTSITECISARQRI